MDWFWCRTPGNNVMYSLYQRDTLYTIYTFPAPFGDQECTCINVINNLYLVRFAIKFYVNWYRSIDWETLRDIAPLWSNGQNGVFSPIFNLGFHWMLGKHHNNSSILLIVSFKVNVGEFRTFRLRINVKPTQLYEK